MMNVRKMSEAIGQTVLVSTDVGGVYCIVDDVRKVWDRVDLLVRPVSGSDKQGKWVSLSRVERNTNGVCCFDLATV
jgi:hypothetical protein